MATQRAHTLLTKCHFIRPDCYGCSNSLYSSDQMSLHQAKLSVMATQTASALLTKCHFIRPDCFNHSKSLRGSDQMSLHQARLSLMATERACSLLTSDQTSLHQAIMLWPSQSLHLSDQMSLHQARLSVMATQRACTFLTKCCSIRPFCLSRPFKELVHFWNVISLLLSYATWVVRGGRNLQFSRYIPTYCSIWWFIHIIIFPVWSWDSLLVRARDSQSKGC